MTRNVPEHERAPAPVRLPCCVPSVKPLTVGADRNYGGAMGSVKSASRQVCNIVIASQIHMNGRRNDVWPRLGASGQRFRFAGLTAHGLDQRSERVAMDFIAFKALNQAVQHRLPLAVLAQLLPQLGQKHSTDDPPPGRAHGGRIIYIHSAEHAGYFGPQGVGRARCGWGGGLAPSAHLSACAALREFSPRSGDQRRCKVGAINCHGSSSNH